jgi:hypothetical protein
METSYEKILLWLGIGAVALYYGSVFLVDGAKGIAENLGIKYFQIETELNDPNMDELIRSLEIMTKFKENKILLHCHRNKRASALLAIYRVNKLGWSKDDALKKVGMVVEGVSMAKTVRKLAKFNLSIPLISSIGRIIFDDISDVRKELMDTINNISGE